MNRFVLQIQLLYLKAFQQPLFIIKISGGFVTKLSGTVKAGFMADCIEIVKRNSPGLGMIYAVKGPYEKPVLHAYGEVDKNTLQQLRNSFIINA